MQAFAEPFLKKFPMLGGGKHFVKEYAIVYHLIPQPNAENQQDHIPKVLGLSIVFVTKFT